MRTTLLRAWPFCLLLAAKFVPTGSPGESVALASSNAPNFAWEWSFLIPGSVLAASLVYRLRHMEPPPPEDQDGDPTSVEL